MVGGSSGTGLCVAGYRKSALVMGASIEITMAAIADPTARVITEEQESPLL